MKRTNGFDGKSSTKKSLVNRGSMYTRMAMEIMNSSKKQKKSVDKQSLKEFVIGKCFDVLM